MAGPMPGQENRSITENTLWCQQQTGIQIMGVCQKDTNLKGLPPAKSGAIRVSKIVMTVMYMTS